ncbi:unnamed protein product [Nezara viridula]|uniref:G-protein coupled receptors family 1 profile domain-containing protein n=1 Tax=Nezara viridula TaxID=85310 RepID=A0A9P0MX87_NEZVI|nr:unnamed protein product [Nezara viridula]
MGDLDLNDTFNATSDEEPIPYSERPETYIVPILFAFIFLVGVLGNGTLVLIFIRHKTMRNVPNTYILSLALGDLLVIVTCVPFTSTVYTFSTWPYGLFVCKLSEVAKDISIGVSVFTLTALSADRFFAIVDPMRKLYSSIGGKGATGCTIMIAIAIWLLAMFCASPAAIGTYIRVFKDPNNVTLFETCYPFPEEWGPFYSRSIVMAKFLVYYAIPLTIIGFFYILMAHHLVLSTRNMPGEAQGQARQIRARKKVAKTVLAFVVVFAICFLPHHIFMLWFYNYPKAQMSYNNFWHIFRIVGFCLTFINSCVNPIALYWVSGTFRKYFNKYLLCWRGHSEESRHNRRAWDSSTLAHLHQSTIRRNDTTVQECTVLTTFANGHQGP